MPEKSYSEVGCIRDLQKALHGLPGIATVRLGQPPSRGDACLDLVVRGQKIRLLVHHQRQVYPRDVSRHLVARDQASPKEAHLLAAFSISPGAREELQREGLNYWDASSGSLFLQLPQALYLVDRPTPSPPRRARQTLFRGVSGLVVHSLLLDPRRAWKVQDLAQQALVSLATVHEVFTALEERGYVEKSGRGPQTVRQLSEPGSLLDEWCAHYSLREYDRRRYFGLARSPAELQRRMEKLLASSQAEYAVTLEAGARRTAPLRTGPLEHWSILTSAPDELAFTLNLADFREVDEGENVLLLVAASAHSTPTPLYAREKIEGVWVASPVQLYLDLMNSPQRGKEQARHVRAQRLGY